MCGTWWWISYGTGQKRTRSVPDDSSTGWGYAPASSTTGENAMGASMSTTVGFPGISGYSRGRNNPSSAIIWTIRWKAKPSRKGTGFEQPPEPHQHWHIDVCYINVSGTFYYLCSILDGFSRSIVHWDLRESMTEAEIEVILQRAREKYPEAKPRIISDNGPQFIARDFKEFIRISGMTHVRTSPYYPQSNGKLERWHKSLKSECIRPGTPLTREDAVRLIQTYVDHYNTVRLHSAIGYVTPHDMLAGRQTEIHAARDRKLEEARHQRQLRRLALSLNSTTMTSPGETEAGSAGMQPC